ncbi:DUF4192 domain-containing protein [Actinosynnema sp. NPDC050436]|uniref:DUF4192 domain-containing protein n=1 Tax=Actinosynnema sp. NPDC050436 TaxID=3155659 RepID=UPI0033CB0E3E
MSDESGSDTGSVAGRFALTGVGDIVAAIPHLLGFHVRDSAVLVVVDDRDTIVVTLRADLPEPRNFRRLADELFASLRHHPGVKTIIAVVVGDDGRSATEGPFLPLATRMEDNARHLGVGIVVVGVPAIAAGVRWFRYGIVGVDGPVPDPDGSLLHVVAAVNGNVTRAGRGELAGLVRPDPVAERDRRAAMLADALDSALRDAGTFRSRESARRRFQAVDREVTRAADRAEGLTDDLVVELGIALSDRRVRDWCAQFALGGSAPAAERLWQELARKLPAPVSAEAATLAAISAYVRGDGTLARIAVDSAMRAAGERHRLGQLIAHAIETGMPPEQMRALCEAGRRAHRDFLDG